MVIFSLTIPGYPVSPQQRRIRQSSSGKFQRYDDGRVKRFSEMIQRLARAKANGRPPIEGSVSVSLRVWAKLPSSFTKAQVGLVRQGILRPHKTPDMDGAMKIVFDSLNGIFYDDDRFIVDLVHPTGRYYGKNDRIDVLVTEPAPSAIQIEEWK